MSPPAAQPSPKVDATELAELRKQQQMLRYAVDAARLGIWELNLQTGELHSNEQLRQLIDRNRSPSTTRLEQFVAMTHPDDAAAWREALARHVADPSRPCRAVLRIMRSGGSWGYVESYGVVVSYDEAGQPLQMNGLLIDVTEQMRMQETLRNAAYTDSLTQMPNRAAVLDQVRLLIQQAQSEPNYRYAVLFMDCDRFKHINDTLGHSIGDALLCQIAQRLRGALRAGDGIEPAQVASQVIGRLGGDEFIIMLPGVACDEAATRVAQRLLHVVSEPYEVETHTVHVTASIGIVTSAQAHTDPHTLLRDVDIAMYEAKRTGTGRYVMFHPSMHARLAQARETEVELRHALIHGELFVVYQPVPDLQHDGPGGVEALARWMHPQRGLISPAQFIPVAEESGLVVDLGRFVLYSACHQFVQWRRELGDQAPRSVAVNLSALQLRDPHIVADVQRCLTETGIVAHQLYLEVTETLAAQDDLARERLSELKALGVRIALDDFGTGYSSLACLHQLPVDMVKIDRSFVAHAETSDYHRVLIEATVRVAQTLGMETVAEGIETEGQARLLRTLQCQRAQGYWFSRPLPASEVPAWQLAQRRLAH